MILRILMTIILYYIIIMIIIKIVQVIKKTRTTDSLSGTQILNDITNNLNKLFKDLEIDLLRYPTYNEYYKDTLKKRIQENIKEHYYIN